MILPEPDGAEFIRPIAFEVKAGDGPRDLIDTHVVSIEGLCDSCLKVASAIVSLHGEYTMCLSCIVGSPNVGTITINRPQ